MDKKTYSNKNETVYIQGGAVIDGWFWAEDAENIKFSGRGIMDGKKMEYLKYVPRDQGRKRFLEFENCKNIELDGFIIHRNPIWGIVPIGCENVKINNVKIISWGYGNDGIDIVSTRKVKISNCFVLSGNDCIAIKVIEGVDNVGDVDVTNSVFWNSQVGSGALEIGFGTRCEKMTGINFRNCDIIHVLGYAAAISIHNYYWASVENVTYEDIRMEDLRGSLVDLTINYTEKSHRRGYIKNIIFKDIKEVDGLFPSSVIQGFDKKHIVKNIRFENLTIHDQKIHNAFEGNIYIKNAKNINFKP